ncbi:MAG: acylphosphatase [Candidatus Aenigmarchaeota archaeon]|nr:acylphosphatase [Candidatus Aenigmarchaeota archaeon]
MKASAHVVVSGSVQGVGFRSFIIRNARSLGLTGWVSNLEDGRVEAVFEGEKYLLDRIINACKKGPSGAKVSWMEISWYKYTGEFKGFEVKY